MPLSDLVPMLKKMDISCAVAASLFIVSNFFGFIYFIRYESKLNFNYRGYMQLEPDFIESEWESRRDTRGIELISGLANVFAWLALCVPVLKVALMMSEKGSRQLDIHLVIAVLVIFGSASEFISNLLYLGMSEACQMLSVKYNLNNWSETTTSQDDQVGWRVLEMVHMVTRGMLAWIDSIEYLFLSGIAGLFYISIKTKTDCLFSAKFAKSALVLSVLCILDFLFEILKFQGWTVGTFVWLLIAGMNRLVILPVWIVWLGIELPEVRSGTNEDLTLRESIENASSMENVDIGTDSAAVLT